MKTRLIVSLLFLLSTACAMRAQAPDPDGPISRPVALDPDGLTARPSTGSSYILIAGAYALPEAPAPVWSESEFTSFSTGTRSSSAAPSSLAVDVYSPFTDAGTTEPLTPAQKAKLAVHCVLNPHAFATIAGSAAFTSITNAHTAYGPGMDGFGRGVGVGLLGDATGQFFGTWAIPSLTREDPRYHRIPHASIPWRVLHAISHTVLTESDSGRAMPNFATLGTYPITAEISNLYVPGIHGNGPSTVARILTGYATDPVDNLVNEFLPDVARHIQLHVVFTQQLLNQISADQYPTFGLGQNR